MIAGGFGPALPQPIAWGAIEDYGDRIRADDGERATLHQVLGHLDAIKLKHDAERVREEVARSKEKP